MAKSNSPGRIPQAQHSEKSPASRHDKRSWLLHFRSDRVRTEKARFPLVGLVGSVVGKMANLLDGRVGFRLCIIMAGAMLAKSRRTASSWFRAAGVGNDWDRFYDGLISVGKNTANLATSQLVGGCIRVVLLEFEKGNWAPYFSTDLELPVELLLEKVSDRWAIEEYFHDVKEVWGAGQQRVRNVWSNIGYWHLNSGLFTLVELASWDEAAPSLVDRTDRP
jgi:hypothetical protein